MTARIQPGDRVRHCELPAGEGVVLSVDLSEALPTAVVRWENGQQARCTLGYLERMPAYAASTSEL